MYREARPAAHAHVTSGLCARFACLPARRPLQLSIVVHFRFFSLCAAMSAHLPMKDITNTTDSNRFTSLPFKLCGSRALTHAYSQGAANLSFHAPIVKLVSRERLAISKISMVLKHLDQKEDTGVRFVTMLGSEPVWISSTTVKEHTTTNLVCIYKYMKIGILSLVYLNHHVRRNSSI